MVIGKDENPFFVVSIAFVVADKSMAHKAKYIVGQKHEK